MTADLGCTCTAPSYDYVQFVPNKFTPPVYPARGSNPNCAWHGQSSTYSLIEIAAQALHEGDWMMVANEWRWSEAATSEKMIARVVASELVRSLPLDTQGRLDAVEDGTLFERDSALWFMCSDVNIFKGVHSRTPRPLSESRIRAKVDGARKALRRALREQIAISATG